MQAACLCCSCAQEARESAAAQQGESAKLETYAEAVALLHNLAELPDSGLHHLACVLPRLAKAPGFRPATTESALQALSELLQKRSVYSEVSASLASAAVPALSSLMQSRGCPAARLLATYTALCLHDLPELQVAVAEGALPAVIVLLQDSERPVGQSLAAMFLALAASHDNAHMCAAQAAVPSLAAMLWACNSVAPMPTCIMQVREAAASALSILTFKDAHRVAVAVAALPALASIIQQDKRPGSRCRRYAAWVLEHLAVSATPWVQQRVADAALPGLVKLMQSTPDGRDRLAAVLAVSALATSQDVQLQEQVRAEAHAALVVQARQRSDIESRTAAKLALKQLQPSCCVVM